MVTTKMFFMYFWGGQKKIQLFSRIKFSPAPQDKIGHFSWGQDL